jgi:adenine phosphoribosyltransferase
MNSDEIRNRIRNVPDFPAKGIVFKDITPILSDAKCFQSIVAMMADQIRPLAPAKLAGIESRGFILAAALAQKMGVGLVLIRKKGKLPWKTLQQSYDLEYGSDTLEVHADSFQPGERVVVVDDVLATGGTAAAALKLCEAAGARAVGLSILIELQFLEGRKKLADRSIVSVMEF